VTAARLGYRRTPLDHWQARAGVDRFAQRPAVASETPRHRGRGEGRGSLLRARRGIFPGPSDARVDRSGRTAWALPEQDAAAMMLSGPPRMTRARAGLRKAVRNCG